MRKFYGAGFAAIFLAAAGTAMLTTNSATMAEEAQSASSEQSVSPEITGRQHKVQVGPWFMARWSVESAPANYMRTVKPIWWDGLIQHKKELDPSFIDPKTGLPHSIPRGSFVSTDYFYGTGGFAGEWVVEAVGDAEISVRLIKNQRRISRNRIEFTLGKNFDSGALVDIHKIGEGGLQELRVFRKEDEARLDAGKYWSTAFLKEVRKYDVIRTMDFQSTNGTIIKSVSDLPTLEYTSWSSGNNQPNSLRSMPLEPLFALGDEAQSEIWFQVPMHLGYPYDWDDPKLWSDPKYKGENNLARIQEVGFAEWREILASPAWDEYADAVVAALASAEYPESKQLYISLGNEVWNYAGYGYLMQTMYANGIGAGYDGDEEVAHKHRRGYGVLFARMMVAMEAAFAKAGRDQKLTYVIESQAANAWQTKESFNHLIKQLESMGESYSDYQPKIGVSIASYWGGYWDKQMSWDDWEAAIKADPVQAAKDRADFLINGPVSTTGTRAWVLQKFAAHQATAQNFGVKLIGAYEGGSHDVRPEQIPGDFFTEYHWGPEGARVNEAVNDAILEAYPDIILSNYALAGAIGGGPWLDGKFGENNPMKQSWAKYLRQ